MRASLIDANKLKLTRSPSLKFESPFANTKNLQGKIKWKLPVESHLTYTARCCTFTVPAHTPSLTVSRPMENAREPTKNALLSSACFLAHCNAPLSCYDCYATFWTDPHGRFWSSHTRRLRLYFITSLCCTRKKCCCVLITLFRVYPESMVSFQLISVWFFDASLNPWSACWKLYRFEHSPRNSQTPCPARWSVFE